MWVFGSALSRDDPRDIDLAVQGVPPREFYRFYSILDDALGKPVDLIDMDSEDPMRHIVSAYGEIIYG
jgi:predicted nucleotidyltransferase